MHVCISTHVYMPDHLSAHELTSRRAHRAPTLPTRAQHKLCACAYLWSLHRRVQMFTERPHACIHARPRKRAQACMRKCTKCADPVNRSRAQITCMRVHVESELSRTGVYGAVSIHRPKCKSSVTRLPNATQHHYPWLPESVRVLSARVDRLRAQLHDTMPVGEMSGATILLSVHLQGKP